MKTISSPERSVLTLRHWSFRTQRSNMAEYEEQVNYEPVAEVPAPEVPIAKAVEEYQQNGASNGYAGQESVPQQSGPTAAPPPGGRHDTSLTPGKVFIGGLDTNTTKEALHDYCAAW